jgi:hypothetical protein
MYRISDAFLLAYNLQSYHALTTFRLSTYPLAIYSTKFLLHHRHNMFITKIQYLIALDASYLKYVVAML